MFVKFYLDCGTGGSGGTGKEGEGGGRRTRSATSKGAERARGETRCNRGHCLQSTCSSHSRLPFLPSGHGRKWVRNVRITQDLCTTKYVHSCFKFASWPYTISSTACLFPCALNNAAQTGVRRGTNIPTRCWYALYATGYLDNEIDSVNTVDATNSVHSTRLGASGASDLSDVGSS